MDDLQQAFDQMVARLYDGRGRAYDEDNNTCEYETQDGVPCVVGCLLPDDHPARQFSYNNEGMEVGELVNTYPDETPEVVKANLTFMIQMQFIHDPSDRWHGNMPAPDVAGLLANIAQNNGLTLNMPETTSPS